MKEGGTRDKIFVICRRGIYSKPKNSNYLLLLPRPSSDETTLISTPDQPINSVKNNQSVEIIL